MKILEWLFGKKEHPAKKEKNHVGCDFGIKEFNTKKRKLLPEEITTANAPTKGG